MNYWKRHIGDYARKAGHLSLVEHGIYVLLLDAYYDREQPLTKAEAVRTSRCRTPEELACLDAVLADFFTEVDGRYVQSRVEEELVKAAENAAKNSRNGKLGGRPRKAKKNPAETQSVSCEKPEERQSTNPLIHQSTKEKEQTSLERQAARFAEFWAAYPVKKGRAAAERTWRSRSLDSQADRILADVKARMAGDRQWLDGFIPHGSTYVSQSGWEDEIEKPRGKQAGSAYAYDPREI